jgi:excinuclease UvrABC nuclease subunit
VPGLPAIFDHAVGFDPAEPIDVFLKQAPARWVVYLMADADDRPVQLLCVKNLRASLKRRLGQHEPAGPTRQVDYRQLVRRVYWRAVDSSLEADLVYLEAARQVFPESYQAMVGFRPAWFVQVDPEAEFPRYTRTTALGQAEGALIGPLEDKHTAARLVELVESIFDLCRYHNILVQAPLGRACAYKEMGRCPAPCDGSIPMAQYRQMVRDSIAAVVNPEPFLAGQMQRMQQAAADLQFEQAAKTRSLIDQASQLGKGPFRHARRLEDFAFISLQRGPKEGQAKLLLIMPGRIEELLGLIDELDQPADVLRLVLARARQLQPEPVTPQAAERIALVAQHLFSGKQGRGVFIRLDEADAGSLLKARRELRRQKAPEPSEAEGIVKELQAM